MTATSFTERYSHALSEKKPTCIAQTNLNFANRISGKVRECYTLSDDAQGRPRKLFVTTDRLSAFDRALTVIPYKGQVLNLTSKWWFEHTRSIVDNHMISVPHPNTMVAEACEVFPVEFVVRGFMTGTTQTSMWHHYQQGSRLYCGHRLPDGMQKNERLPKNLLTPTTKSEHDELTDAQEIVQSGRMSADHWEQCEHIALSLFEFGQKVAQQRGLILVDTKYEMGLSRDGRVVLIDEIHTPDSSRYWLDLNDRVPTTVDKDFIRQWYVAHCDPYQDPQLPEAPTELVNELAARYIYLYERITGEFFTFNDPAMSDDLQRCVESWLQQH